MTTYAANSATTPTSGGDLVCRTDRTDCCDAVPGRIRGGEWRYPDGVNLVRNSGKLYPHPHPHLCSCLQQKRATGFWRGRRRHHALLLCATFEENELSVADPNARICINLSKMN